ncbi:unnamed protein product [Knipowitschia caucasica]|uniref:Immunoglobulin domain-containing protein n=1 Tax=Knipowitschia caucasica TaxID=637954 RepID=A0AAV2M860_KNICA
MRNAFLFVLIFSAGCDDADVDGCTGGWFEFKCSYSRGEAQNVKVSLPRGPELPLKHLVKNKWRDLDGIRSVYQNTTGKYFSVLVKNLSQNDFGKYECRRKSKKTGIDLKKGNRACGVSSMTVYQGSSTTIQCAPNSANFICKENPTEPECDILDSAPVYSLRAASEQDQGTYWCGFQSERPRFRVAWQKIQLQVVNVTQNRLRLSPGQNSSYPCPYPDGLPLQKFVCKGDNSSACPNISSKFSLEDVSENQTVIITVHGVTEEDSGWYWFGAESSSGNEKHFFHKLLLLVKSESSTTLPNKNNTSPIYPSTSSQPHKQDERWKSIVIGVVVGVILLLLAVALLCLHRHRCCFVMVPTADKEDHYYDEIQERPQQVGAAALSTIYATATLDTVAQPGAHHRENKLPADEAFKDNILYMQQYS